MCQDRGGDNPFLLVTHNNKELVGNHLRQNENVHKQQVEQWYLYPKKKNMDKKGSDEYERE